MEDDLTVVAKMRRPEPSRFDRPFMSAGELLYLRKTIMRVTQERLCEQLLNPSTGDPMSISIVCLWEKGRRDIPLWAARRVRELAECHKRADAKVGMVTK